jgi:hypothetical protein
LIQAPNAQNLPLPSIVPPKLLTPDDIGNNPNKVMPAKESLTTSSSSKKQSSKSKKKKTLLRAMALMDSLSGSDGDDDDDTASEASSVAAYDPQINYFGNSGFDSQEYVPGLEDLRCADKVSDMDHGLSSYSRLIFSDSMILMQTKLLHDSCFSCSRCCQHFSPSIDLLLFS